mmetsp:Transcript_9054/g.27249  ORF Transcript_9054/g.27249 Transcript_9054/m.27249 type:complete len:307 (-) Transcript_9054:496-1416(-)
MSLRRRRGRRRDGPPGVPLVRVDARVRVRGPRSPERPSWRRGCPSRAPNAPKNISNTGLASPSSVQVPAALRAGACADPTRTRLSVQIEDAATRRRHPAAPVCAFQAPPKVDVAAAARAKERRQNFRRACSGTRPVRAAHFRRPARFDDRPGRDVDVRLAVLRPNETRKGPRRRDDAGALGRGALGAGRAVLLGLRVGRSMGRSTGIASLGHPRAVGTRAARGADPLGVDGLRRGRLGAVGSAVGGAARRAEPPVVLGAAVAVRGAERGAPAAQRGGGVGRAYRRRRGRGARTRLCEFERSARGRL